MIEHLHQSVKPAAKPAATDTHHRYRRSLYPMTTFNTSPLICNQWSHKPEQATVPSYALFLTQITDLGNAFPFPKIFGDDDVVKIAIAQLCGGLSPAFCLVVFSFEWITLEVSQTTRPAKSMTREACIGIRKAERGRGIEPERAAR